MSQRQTKLTKCSVVGCERKHRRLHALPASEELKTQWITFILMQCPHNNRKIHCVWLMANVANVTVSFDFMPTGQSYV